MTFDPSIDAVWLWLLALVGAALVALLLWKDSRMLPARIWVRSALLRTLGLAGLVLLLLNPSFVTSEPDPEAYHVTVLADVSASMLARDLPGKKARLDVLQEAVSGGLVERLSDHQKVRFRSFARETREASAEALTMQPGQTALGEALLSALTSEGRSDPLGAVLLISDGISLRGIPPVDAAKAYRNAGVPVSVVGMGRTLPEGDIEVKFEQPRVAAVRGEPFDLQGRIRNTFPHPVDVTVELLHKDEVADTYTLQLDAGEAETVRFTQESSQPGFESYRLRLRTDAPDLNPATDVDYAAVEVTHPDRFRVLLLSASPSWQSRFVQMAVDDHEQFTLHRILRVGEERFVETSTDPDFVAREAPEFPQRPEELMDYEAVVVDTGTLSFLEETVVKGLERFVSNRGGGVLFYGSEEPLAEAGIRQLLPVRGVEQRAGEKERETLAFDETPVFVDQASGPLFQVPGPFVPEEEPIQVPEDTGRAARVVGQTRAEQQPFLVVQSYGAGRTGFIASDATWRWRMDSDRGMRQFDQFWRGLLSWLATGGQPRLKAAAEGELVSLEKKADLSLRVLGGDFRPRSDAQVRAIVTGPDGDERPITLSPSLREPGAFEAAIGATESGDYQVDYLVQFPDGENLTHSAWFTAVAQGEESRDTRFREGLLRDIARLTGGEYYNFDQLDDIERVKVSPEIPEIEDAVHWARTGPFLAVLLTIFGLEWYLRRKEGLR